MSPVVPLINLFSVGDLCLTKLAPPHFDHTLVYHPKCVQPLCATLVCHPCVPPLCATLVCHPCVPPLCATLVCHPCVPPMYATPVCHTCVPPLCATHVCHPYVPSLCAILVCHPVVIEVGLLVNKYCRSASDQPSKVSMLGSVTAIEHWTSCFYIGNLL